MQVETIILVYDDGTEATYVGLVSRQGEGANLREIYYSEPEEIDDVTAMSFGLIQKEHTH